MIDHLTSQLHPGKSVEAVKFLRMDIDNLVKLAGKGLTEKQYLSFSKVTYALCTEILDSPRFSPISEGY